MRRMYLVPVCVALATIAMLAQKPALAADPPLFENGQTYVVLWACLPQIGCASELLEVQRVRKDGWVDVKDRNNDAWTINPAQALAVKPHTAGRALAD